VTFASRTLFVSGEGNEELGAELPARWSSSPHGGIGAGVGDCTVGQGCNPVAVLSGERIGGGYVDGVRDAFVCQRIRSAGEVLLEERDVGVARGHKSAIADDDNEVFVEGLGDHKRIALSDAAIGAASGRANEGFGRFGCRR
jgi:hypothetical protein